MARWLWEFLVNTQPQSSVPMYVPSMSPFFNGAEIYLTCEGFQSHDELTRLFEAARLFADIYRCEPVLEVDGVICIVSATSNPALMATAYPYAAIGYFDFVPPHPCPHCLTFLVYQEALDLYLECTRYQRMIAKVMSLFTGNTVLDGNTYARLDLGGARYDATMAGRSDRS